jgi:hypothetical protein
VIKLIETWLQADESVPAHHTPSEGPEFMTWTSVPPLAGEIPNPHMYLTTTGGTPSHEDAHAAAVTLLDRVRTAALPRPAVPSTEEFSS